LLGLLSSLKKSLLLLVQRATANEIVCIILSEYYRERKVAVDKAVDRFLAIDVALFYALRSGTDNYVRDCTTTDPSGNNVLHIAVMGRHYTIVRELLQKKEAQWLLETRNNNS